MPRVPPCVVEGVAGAPKLQEALRKARQQTQTPPVEVRVKSCENFLERARKNVSKSQEEVAKGQQAMTEAQQLRLVGRRGGPGGREVDYPPDRNSQSLCGNGTGLSGLGNRVAEVARKSERIAGPEHGAPGILQASSSGHVDLRGSTRTLAEGGFCRHEVDARSSSRHARGNHGR